MTPFTFVLALAAGSLMSIYVPMISRSAQVLGSGPMANVPFFFIAFVSSVAIAFGTGHRVSEIGKVRDVPPHLLTAGIMSACLIIASSYLVPRIGIGSFFVLVVAGQVLTSMMFGHLGVFGAPQTALTFAKVAGAALVIGGVYLTTFG